MFLLRGLRDGRGGTWSTPKSVRSSPPASSEARITGGGRVDVRPSPGSTCIGGW